MCVGLVLLACLCASFGALPLLCWSRWTCCVTIFATQLICVFSGFLLTFLSVCDASEILVARAQEFLLCVVSFACADVLFAFGAPFFAWPFADRS